MRVRADGPYRSKRDPRVEALDAYLADKPALRAELSDGAQAWPDFRMGPRAETYEVPHGPMVGVGVAYRDRGRLLVVHLRGSGAPVVMATQDGAGHHDLAAIVLRALSRGRSDSSWVAEAIAGSVDRRAWREAFQRLPHRIDIDHLDRVPASRAGRVLDSLVDEEIQGDAIWRESDLPIMSGLLHSDRDLVMDHLARGLPRDRLDALVERHRRGPMSFGHAVRFVLSATSPSEAHAEAALAALMAPTVPSRVASRLTRVLGPVVDRLVPRAA